MRIRLQKNASTLRITKYRPQQEVSRRKFVAFSSITVTCKSEHVHSASKFAAVSTQTGAITPLLV